MADRLIKFYLPDELADSQLTSAFVICFYQSKLLLGYNNWRKQLEVPAGKREEDEAILETAKREFFEETHQLIESPKLIQIAEIENELGHKRYHGIFFTVLDTFVPFKQQKADEMDFLKLISLTEMEKANMDPLDKKIILEMNERGLINENLGN